jgi:hypothetical protein
MIKEKVHPVTGEKYIEGNKKIIFESGVVMTPAEFAQTTMMSRQEIGALMQELAGREDRYKFDYKYALTTGILRHYQKKPETSSEPAKTVEKLQKPKVQRKITPAVIILAVMVITGFMSACMSAYHTTKAMGIFGRPTPVGIITGTVMVLFSATAFTAARWFWQEKSFVRGFAVLFVMLGAMVIAYSMLSTLVVNFNAWSSVEEVQKTEVAENSEELIAYETQIKLKQDELDELTASEEKISTEADYWKDKSWKRYDALQEQITAIREKISAARSELSSLISSKPAISSRVAEQKEDVFTFLSTFIKVNPRTLRLFMQAVPAMFFDIIAPFALSCAIYLAEKRKEEVQDA